MAAQTIKNSTALESLQVGFGSLCPPETSPQTKFEILQENRPRKS